MPPVFPKILYVGKIQPRSSWNMPAHLHPHHELVVITQGVLNLKINGEILTAVPGDVLFYHAGGVHKESSDTSQPVGSYFLGFRMGGAIDLPVRIRDEGGRIRQMMAWIHSDHEDLAEPGISSGLLRAILLQLDRLFQQKESPWLTGLRHRMQENMKSDLDLAMLANWGGMSKFAFARKYKRLSGRSPILELRMIRLAHARSLLFTTSLPLKQIAEASHLGDESQLSKLFYRHFSMWPGELRMRPKQVRS